ncbi:acetate/propionate family kinase [Kineococcus indalonis]|uniref:acetate/propionate family kinase n=1 Tax=Kineococcus indalonis TaxID=2696566 RepID=UPI001412E3C9|nr:acetate kinase [Kineococcus indalonis]NAZ86679.1 acetate/propionate family kinase [Kineococcus indalonis]
MPTAQSSGNGSVVVVNCGSSSVKLAVVDPATGERSLSCLGERLGTPDAVVHFRTAQGERTITPAASTHRGALAHVLQRLLDMELPPLLGVGHRVVQGGKRFRSSVLVDDHVLHDIADLSALAPLHNPANAAGIEAARAVLPELDHVAVFDTAFHQTVPEHAYRYAVPARWYEEFGVRRYGMHGTSHRFVSQRAAEVLAREAGADPGALKLVVAHLGNGCSATAVLGGRSVDTTMGLTPLEGLVMGTRSGDLDPAVLELVAERTGASTAQIVEQLNSESGLLALSGLSNDVRTLTQEAARGHAGAKLALEVFTYRAAKHVAALTVALGGLDALVLTGGIGEHAVGVRSALLARLEHLGLVEDPGANAEHGRTATPAGRITREHPGGRGPLAMVVPTDEELLIARDTAELVRRG